MGPNQARRRSKINVYTAHRPPFSTVFDSRERERLIQFRNRQLVYLPISKYGSINTTQSNDKTSTSLSLIINFVNKIVDRS